MRVLIRTSRWAIWSRRVGTFALALVISSIALHRFAFLESATFVWLAGGAWILAVLAILFGFAAYIRLWFTGDRGWARATLGVVLGLVALAPIFVSAYQALEAPWTNYVSTTDPHPMLISAASENLNQRVETSNILAQFPNIYARSARLDAGVMFDLVLAEMELREWTILAARRPTQFQPTGQINAQELNWMGFAEEISVSVQTQGQRVHVNAISASAFAAFDFGSNGRRLEDFLLALDEEINAQIARASVPAENSAPG